MLFGIIEGIRAFHVEDESGVEWVEDASAIAGQALVRRQRAVAPTLLFGRRSRTFRVVRFGPGWFATGKFGVCRNGFDIGFHEGLRMIR